MSDTFGNAWVSNDRTEMAVEVIDSTGQTEVFIMQALLGRHGPEPVITDCAVAPEALESGWTFIRVGD